MSRCFVQLGRLGDIMNVLGLVWEASRTGGELPYVLVGAQFADLLDGCSYCIPDVWQGDWEDLAGAMKYAGEKYDEVLCTQVHSTNYPHSGQTDSYARDSWAQIGRLDWGSLPLVFDLRNECREAMHLIRTSLPPVILVATHGQSSKFEKGAELVQSLRDKFGDPHVTCLDFKAERIYDLLGLYDRAACLVTIDTATMHLAHASKVPVIALHSDAHHGWGATPRYPGQVFRQGYHECYRHNGIHVLNAVEALLNSKRERKIFHVWSEYQRDPEAQKRHDVARGTWVKEYSDRWTSMPVADSGGLTSASIGDPRPVPFVNDLVDRAMKIAEPDDLIVLCNEDIQFVPGLGRTIEEFRGECAWSNRRDFDGIDRPVTVKAIIAGTIYPGTDFFVFTKRWWYDQDFPLMYLGRQQWDLVVRTAMRLDGGVEIPCATAHNFHDAYWRTGNHEHTNPANRWNYEQSAKWHSSNGLPVP